MIKVLFGEDYTFARLVGIKAEVWAIELNKEPNFGDTLYGFGEIKKNKTTNKFGLIVNTTNPCFLHLNEIHKNKLINIIGGDGWLDEEIIE
jgi:hypothetical protein